MKKLLLSLLIVLACALPVQAAEMVTIENVSKDEVYNEILTVYMKNGFMIQESNEHNLIFRSDNVSMNFAITWGSKAYIQHYFNLAQIKNDVLVSHEIRVIDGDEVSPLTREAIPRYFTANKEYAEEGLSRTVAFISGLKAHFNGRYFYGFMPGEKKKKDYIEILEVFPSYSAEKIGLKPNDQIIKINGQVVKKISRSIFDVIAMESALHNQPIHLEIRRKKEILKFTLKPDFAPAKKSEAP